MGVGVVTQRLVGSMRWTCVVLSDCAWTLDVGTIAVTKTSADSKVVTGCRMVSSINVPSATSVVSTFTCYIPSPCTSSRIFKAPAFCQSRNLRQHVTPEPDPISCGKYSHGIPVFNTKMIPAKRAQSCTLGRTPHHLARRFGLGSSGSITAHSSSLANSCSSYIGHVHRITRRAIRSTTFC
jgi:hypothetical protein